MLKSLKSNSYRFVVVLLLLLTFLTTGMVGKVIPSYALAVGPLADPVYDTELYALRDYVEQNLDEPQLDIMMFLIGGLAVAQMGAQDAMLISPYPNEENVKEWIINCGIQLYNAVIGLVPEGDYYVGIPSIGSSGTHGIPRQLIKALVAQMMGDAVVAINYPDLDTFLTENPNELYLPINPDLQLGVNAIFGLGGGLGSWQNSTNINASFTWRTVNMNSTATDTYNTYRNTYFTYPTPVNANSKIVNSSYWPNYYLNGLIDFDISLFRTYHNIFVMPDTHIYQFLNDSGENILEAINFPRYVMSAHNNGDSVYLTQFTTNVGNGMAYLNTYSKEDVIRNIYNGTFPYFCLNSWTATNLWISTPALLAAGVDFDFYYGTDWAHRIQFEVTSDLNLDNTDMSAYYNQLTAEYLFDLRGLMSDLVNYIYLNKIWDNIYDPSGILVSPDSIKVSVDLTPITELLNPALPVNLNDIELYTDNEYLDVVKHRALQASETIGEYVAFWHNCDSELVYAILGSFIVILIGAFIGKWGHS